MTSPILVTGGTGTLGRLVVRRLRGVGRNVNVLSRRSNDSEDDIRFLTGEGIVAAAANPRSNKGANAADGGEPKGGTTEVPRNW